jgi:putative intracellular protease/amidase
MEESPSSARILIVVTSQGFYGNTKTQTGVWFEEVTHFLHAIVPLGIEYDFVSPGGGKVPIDPKSGSKSDKINNSFLKSSIFTDKFYNTLKPDRVDSKNYIAIYFAGGHGTMWDIAENTSIAKITAEIYESGGYVIAVCHGVCGLLNVVLKDSSRLLDGKTVTGFSNAEETIVSPKTIPFMLEDKLKERGAKYSSRYDKWTCEMAFHV